MDYCPNSRLGSLRTQASCSYLGKYRLDKGVLAGRGRMLPLL
jgi:hypothetical protein